MYVFEHARQGDVKIDRVAALPQGLAPKDRDQGLSVLAYGEVTGHKHYFKEDHVQLFANDNLLYMVITGRPATLFHEEHDPITFAPGVYEVRRQREWSDKEEPVPVCD